MSFYRMLLLCVTFALGAFPHFAFAQADNQALTGEWTTDCLPIGKNGRHGYVTRVRVDGGEIRATSQIFAKSSCETPTVLVNYVGTLSDISSEGDHVDFSHRVELLSFTPNHEDVVTQYNRDPDGAGCGLTGWKLGVEVSVAGRRCAPFSFAGESVTLYDRAWIDGNALRFGNFPSVWSAVSASERPSKPADVIFHRTGG